MFLVFDGGHFLIVLSYLKRGGIIPVIFTPKQFIADGGIKVFVGELNQVYFKIGTANDQLGAGTNGLIPGVEPYLVLVVAPPQADTDYAAVGHYYWPHCEVVAGNGGNYKILGAGCNYWPVAT